MIDSLYLATDNHSLEVLETIKDSLTVVVPHIREMAENSKPEPYTVQNITIASWNLLIAVVAALFGFLGALFGYLGYKFSKQTARNVVRVSADVQLHLCYDFIIDLYRNTMRAVIYGQAYKDKKDLQINNIIALKLTCFDDIFHIDAYISKASLIMMVSLSVLEAFSCFGPLFRCFLLFQDMLSVIILYYYWQRHIAGEHPFSWSETFFLLSAFVLIGSINYCFISPFAVRFIKS